MSEVARQERSARRVWARPGSRHDRIVALAQVVLPMAIGVLVAFLVMAPMFTRGEMSFVLDKNRVAVAEERMRIQAASYRGQDVDGQPFVLEAGSAVQRSSARPVVEIDRLAARIQLRDGPARLTAPGGRYDMATERADVAGPIAFRAADGYAIDTDGVSIDMRDRTLATTSPVRGTTNMGSFSGDRMRADLDERVVRLEGNARLRIDPGATR